MTTPIAFVCEAQADFALAADLADRVLQEDAGLAELFADYPADSVRIWLTWESETYLRWANVSALAKEQKLPIHGHFQGQPGDLYAREARAALLLCVSRVDQARAVLLVHDLDRRPGIYDGYRQAIAEFTARYAPDDPPFAIIVGIAGRMREAWVLAGFDPADEREEGWLNELRQRLGFCPCSQSQRLSGHRENNERNAKNVLAELTADSWARQELCWRVTPLSTLEQRGQTNGLADFLKQLREQLLPICRRP